jgi:hypothetical protein
MPESKEQNPNQSANELLPTAEHVHIDAENWITQLSGASKLYDWFSGWPSFHDSEIIEMCLRRRKGSWMKVRTSEGKIRVGDETRHPGDLIVTFRFDQVEDLELYGFSQQNVVFSIEFEKLEDIIQVKLNDCYGIAGTLSVKNLSFDSTPLVGILDE